MFGPNSVLDMGRWALFASQAAIQVTGENIANVNTEGYCRRYVSLEEGVSINYSPGQMGTGVVAREVCRHFDQFIEEQYYDQATLRERWSSLYANLSGVENLFNESQGYGLSDSLSTFFNSWSDLSQRPEDYGSRRTLMDDSLTLISTLSQLDTDLYNMQLQAEDRISQEVTRANALMSAIAEINKEITINDIPGINNANALYDQRDRLVRELGEILDINYIDNGAGNVTITTKAGQNLVDGSSYFSLVFDSPEAVQELTSSSVFDGQVYYEGSDSYEYTLEVLSDGLVTSGAGAATFRVSLDGGVTWLTDEDGNQREFSARAYGGRISVEGLNIWFGDSSDPQIAPTTALSAGDRFIVSPKKDLYWVENTSHRENITPMIGFTGEDNDKRITGGTLCGYFNLRDKYIGSYRDKLDSLAEGIIWEVNRRHSQGVGLEKYSYIEGSYSVLNDDYALGSNSSGLAFGGKLASGGTMIAIYDTSTGLLVSNAALDWSAAAGQQNFDPNSHSLNSAAAAFNRSFGTYLTASIVNHKLHIQVNDGYELGFGTDSTGLTAALGLNTFFDGHDAGTISINDRVSTDLDLICAGHINGAGEANPGDNLIAEAIAGLQTEEVVLSTVHDGSSTQTLVEYYNALVGSVGTDTSKAEFNYAYTKTLADDLNERQQEVCGVNLDEEMNNLIKYQASYTAAAKLITTADEMLQTLLALKS
ncbi:MAG: flagellar hook-associated protein FlgK [Desulfovibrionaceae bacterium]|nr:flagellar hook-associated protein FlgK [Desulfovibrionaceae bacterium]MDD4951239.1 flagellar hook-associated protein FlgK [Desulfovibrionaceae bacterium]